jgi:predicted  nucleic acid-binding Zn-ribbon protein
MMMEEVFAKLRSLQEVLSQKYQVEKEIKDIPTALATKTELLNRLKQSYIRKNEDINTTKDRVKSTRIRMLEAESERENSEQKMDLIKTQREYEALDKEIKDATAKEQDLRLELQNLEKAQEDMQTELGKEELMIQKQEEELKNEQSHIKHEIREKTKVLQKLEKDEEKIIPGLDEEILFKFERIIRSKAGLGIVPVIEGVCTGCHMILTPQFVNDVRLGSDIMFCPDCSRILFFQEEAEAADEVDIFADVEPDSDSADDEDSEEDSEGEDTDEEDASDEDDSNEDDSSEDESEEESEDSD